MRHLQQAFRENVEATPFGYLHDYRLERVHYDLVHGREASVTEVVLRWGVYQLGRFAGAYRAKFSRLSSHTLSASA